MATGLPEKRVVNIVHNDEIWWNKFIYIPVLVVVLLLCSHFHNDAPPEPQQNASMAAVWGAITCLGHIIVVFILKDHVRHENTSQRHTWPATWGYLVYEYHKLNRELEGRPVSSRPPSAKKGSFLAGQKLPPIIPPRRPDFPMTTSKQIGWLVVRYGPNSALTGRYGREARGKCTIIRRLKWPNDSAP